MLGRLLRDHITRYPVDARSEDEGGRAESIRIDNFALDPITTSPACDLVWWSGWAILLVQIGIAIAPWVLFGDWGVMMVSLCGNGLAAITCAMPQWTEEKWSGRTLQRDKVTCLTGGNGHHHIMVFLGRKGSWDLESVATGRSTARPETRWISLALAMLWMCLLITVAGLKEHAWFLIAIGGIGMLQNAFAAGTTRKPEASNFHITKFSRAPTIIGKRRRYEDSPDAHISLDRDLAELTEVTKWVSEKGVLVSTAHAESTSPSQGLFMPRWLDSMSKEDGVPSWLEPIKPQNDVIIATGVHGALMELEKWVPTAGLAMVQLFFPGSLKYNDESIRDNIHKTFWQKAYHTKSVRKGAEEKRRALQASTGVAIV